MRWIAAAVIGVLAILYLQRFVTSGGKRLEMYRLLGQVYLLLPDQLVSDLVSIWTEEKPAQASVLDRVPVFAVAALLLAAAWGAGSWTIRPALRRRLTGLEAQLLAVAVGLNFWSLWVLVLGLAGGLHSVWLLRGPMLVAVLLGLWHAMPARSRTGRTEQPTSSNDPITAKAHGLGRLSFNKTTFALLAIVLPFVVFYLLAAAMPPWEFDAREYHLQVPKEWFQQGRIGFLAHNVYGNMPLGSEMQALAAMMWMRGDLAWWWGTLAGKVVMASIALLTAVALYAFGRRYFNAWAGAVAAIVYLTMPWIFHVSVSGLVEAAVGFYLWMAVYLLALEFFPTESDAPSPTEARQNTGSLDIFAHAGFLTGAAVACKYTSLVLVAVPLTAAVILYWLRYKRHGAVAQRSRGWIAVLLYGAMMLIACGPWLAKNLVLTGNPTYPLLYSVFGGRTWNLEKNERWKRAHGPPRNDQQQRFSPAQLRAALIDVGWYSDKLTPLMIPLALFALLARRQRRLLALLLAILVIDFVAWWSLTHRYDRFFLPLVPLVALMAGVGADWTSQRWWRRFVVGFIAVGAILNFFIIATGKLTGDARILVPLETLRRDETNSLRVHPAHRYLNDHVPAGHAALIVGDAQVFDLEIPIYYHTCWDDCIFELWMKDRTREQRLDVLRQHHISHVFIHWDEIARYREPGNYGYTDYVTRQLVRDELVGQQHILRPVAVPLKDGILHEKSGQVFEVVYQ